MKILALETSTEAGSCALYLDGTVLERHCPAARPHSETLLPLVRELLGDGELALGDLDAIAFGRGPGAFTGLRVACGVAQGLAAGAGLSLIGIGSLEALAWNAGGDAVLAVLDARMGEIYCAAFRRSRSELRLADGVRVLAPGDLILPEGAWQAAGNALAAYPELYARLRSAGFSCQADAMPSAAAVAQLAAGRWLQEGGLDAADATPFYVRDKVARTTAERLAKGGRA